jgi:hypothetical protein
MAPKTRKQAVTGGDVVADARRYLGVPYVYGGTNRQSGLDCSGLVLVVCEDLRIAGCPRTSEEQWAWVHPVAKSDAATGDLVFFTGAELDPPPGHVGIVVTKGIMIDSPHTGSVVSQTTYPSDGSGVDHIVGVGRIPGVGGTASEGRVSKSASSKQGSQANTEAGAVGALVGWVIIAIGFAIILGLFALLGLFAFAR